LNSKEERGVIVLSIIIPAFNEERYLPGTLDHLRRATEHLRADKDRDVVGLATSG